jgi:hypothetical protein
LTVENGEAGMPILTINSPRFHQQSITNSPQKIHVQPPVFAKTPSKAPSTASQKNLEIEDLVSTPRKFSAYGERPKDIPKFKATKFLRGTSHRPTF